MQGVQIEGLGDFLTGKFAGQGGQGVALLRQLLLQRRKIQLCLRQGSFLRRDVRAGHLSQLLLHLKNFQQVDFDADGLLGRLDLAAQRCFWIAPATTLEVRVSQVASSINL